MAHTIEQLVVFKLGENRYGIEPHYIQEVSRLKEIIINPVPRVPLWVEGIVNLRGEVVPVINLRKKIGTTFIEEGKKNRLIVIKMASSLYGILVDEILGVTSLAEFTIHSAAEGIGPMLPEVSSIAQSENELIFILDMNEVIKTV